MSKKSFYAYTQLILAVLLLLILALAFYRQHNTDSAVEIFPSLNNTQSPERCLTCHTGIEEISASHPVEVFGCVSCHGGVGVALDKDLAHADMITNPGNLTAVESACGDCHPDQIYRVNRSVQATYTGAIALIRRAFGAQPDEKAYMGMIASGDFLTADIAGDETVASIEQFHTAPDDLPLIHQFADNCLICHLQGKPIDEPYFYRSTGCSTCHVLYENDGLYRGNDSTLSKSEPGHPAYHRLTTVIPYRQCNHCHNRGNYDLTTMNFVRRSDLDNLESLNTTDRRVTEYYQPIGLFTRCEWELDCMDCHTQNEVMGDGHIYNNQAATEYIRCKTCHGTLTEPPQTAILSSDDELALRLIDLNPYIATEIGQTVIATERGELFTHVIQQPDGTWELTSRVHGTRYAVPLVMNSYCEQNPAEQESHYCHECHAYDRE